MSTDAKVGERNTLKGMNPPDEQPPDEQPPDEQPASSPSPRVNTEEFDAPDWQGLSQEEIELLKQGKSLKRGPVPIAGVEQKKEPIDPTPVELPRHATAYEAPHEAAALTEHKTIETKTIKVDPAPTEAQRVPTQRSLKRPPRRPIEPTAAEPTPTPTPASTSKRWMILGIVVLAVTAAVAVSQLSTPDQTEPEVTASPPSTVATQNETPAQPPAPPNTESATATPDPDPDPAPSVPAKSTTKLPSPPAPATAKTSKPEGPDPDRPFL